MKKVVALIGITLVVVVFFYIRCESEKTDLLSENLTEDEFEKKINSLTSYLLIDLRTDEEIAFGKIPGAIQIDYYREDFEMQIKGLAKDKPVLIYCASGGRSGKTLIMMRNWSFKEVYNLIGGFKAWKEAGKQSKK